MRILLSALFAILVSPAPSSPSDLVPFVLKAESQGMPFGLLYTPEVLAALVANKPPDTIPRRVAEAIRNGDAIVVMWALPLPPPVGTSLSPRPYKIAAVNFNPAISIGTAETPWNIPERIEPKWIEQDAGDLAQIDMRNEFRDVGAMAAFPREVFMPGRRLYLWQGPETQADTSRVGQSRWAVIEWNGNQALLQRRQQ
jgi:hypothetical protein